LFHARRNGIVESSRERRNIMNAPLRLFREYDRNLLDGIVYALAILIPVSVLFGAAGALAIHA